MVATINEETAWSSFEEKTIEDPSNAESGSGGSTLSIWKDSRLNKLKELAKGGAFTNASSFSIPAAVVGSNTNPWPKSPLDNEAFAGLASTGSPIQADGKPMPGSAYIQNTADDTVLASQDVAGDFLIYAPPPAGVQSGSDSQLGTYKFRFRPDRIALDYTAEDIGRLHHAGSIQYGQIDGTVTDYNGDPLPGEVVYGEGNATKTNSSGYYRVDAPGGTSVDLAAIGKTETLTPSAGQTITTDWQTSRIELEVVTPDLDPVAGTTVQIGDETFKTDENGVVNYDPARIVKHEILVSQEVKISIDVTAEGELYEERVGGEDDRAGVSLKIVDAESNLPVRNVPIAFPGRDLVAHSGRDGTASIFTDDAEAETLEIAGSDRRYRTQEYDLSLSGGDTVTGRVEVEPVPQVSQR